MKVIQGEKASLQKEVEKLQDILSVCRKINIDLDQKIESIMKEKGIPNPSSTPTTAATVSPPPPPKKKIET